MHLMGTAQWETSADELPIPSKTVAASLTNVPEPDMEERESRCMGAVCILGIMPLELEDSTLHQRLVAAVNVTLDHEVKTKF